MRLALALLVVLVAACGPAGSSASDGGYVAGLGTEDARDATCLACHSEVAQDWTHESSHRLLLGCTGCHQVKAGTPGPGHAQLPACGACHSQQTHEDLACATCHQQHGSQNAFLFREEVTLVDGTEVAVHLTKPEGATPDGLAHGGTGACEVCHDTTTHYNRDGHGTPHDTSWCISCHRHEDGFAPSAPP